LNLTKPERITARELTFLGVGEFFAVRNNETDLFEIGLKDGFAIEIGHIAVLEVIVEATDNIGGKQ
jgi:hypothetical protein